MTEFCAVVQTDSEKAAFYGIGSEAGKSRAPKDCQAVDFIQTQLLCLPESQQPFEPDRLSEETRKLHIAPLLDHNYASRPPNTKIIQGYVMAQTKPSNTFPTTTEQLPECSTAAAEPETAVTSTSEVPADIKDEPKTEPVDDLQEVKEEPVQPDGARPQTPLDVKSEALSDTSETVIDLKPSEGPSSQMSDDVAEPEAEASAKEASDSWQDEDYVTRCICGFDHDDGYMISCDKCMVWQHVDCMGVERGNIPDEYLCELCLPRRVDRAHAAALQRSKKKVFEEMLHNSDKKANRRDASSSDQSNSDGENAGSKTRRKADIAKQKSMTNKRKKSVKPIVPVLKKKKTISKREIRPVRRDYPAEEEPLISMEPDLEGSEDEDLRSWIDSYEEAITNHYSPELRARISALKNVELHSPQRLIGAHQARPKVRVTTLAATSRKVLLAGCNIASSQPIIEIRGKYMLDKSPGGAEGSPPLPANPKLARFVFSHRLIGPGPVTTAVLVDTSTYGNSARFVRSSCYPNAQILHCIEKGTLHLYIVSSKAIDARKEITLPHRPGVRCCLGEDCGLIAEPWKRRNRKQVLVERTTSREASNVNNNNNYGEFPVRKRSSSSERAYASKATKSSSSSSPSAKVTKKSRGTVLRSQIASQLKRNETKFVGQPSTKKP